MLASLPDKERQQHLSQLTTEQQAALRFHWPFWARPNQLVPEGQWRTWLILAGRGWGKTRTGAETIRQWVMSGKYKRIALVGETTADVRSVMVDGESGLLNIGPKDERPEYFPSLRQLKWPNGAIATTYNATEPDQLRGPQHDAAWCDELAKWQYLQETWDQLQFGLRLGDDPRTIITTTPRPLPILKKMINDPSVFTTRGSTMDNKDNMAAGFFATVQEKYGNTRLGRQELEGEILDDVPGALWSRTQIDENRLREAPVDLEQVLVAVDPAATSGEDADESGIIVIGLARDNEGYARGYVLEDGSVKGTPEEWARKAVSLYRKWSADKIIAEKNNGGEMVSSVLKAVDRSIPIKLVHASRGKVVRAEPISALYEQGRVHHCGRFDKLEDQMCTFSQDNLRSNAYGSPDRVDALVWGLTEVFEKIAGRRRHAKETNSSSSAETFGEGYINYEHLASPNGWMSG